MWAITPAILLKKNLAYSSIFKVYLRVLLPQRHLLFLLKTDTEAAVRKWVFLKILQCPQENTYVGVSF